jgi:hypothetical protein
MRGYLLALLLLLGLATCSNKALDCEKVAPDDCARYSQCRTIAAGGLNESCVHQYYNYDCWPVDRPNCDTIMYARDSSGVCWVLADCLIPNGYQPDGTCRTYLDTIVKACFPQDGGARLDGGGADVGVP